MLTLLLISSGTLLSIGGVALYLHKRNNKQIEREEAKIEKAKASKEEPKLWKPRATEVSRHFSKRSKINSKIGKEMNPHSRRNRGLAGVVSLVIKADGRRTVQEIKMVDAYLMAHYQVEDYREIVRALKVNLKINNPNFIQMSCDWLVQDMDYTELLGTMECLFDVAQVNYGIDPIEWKLLADVMDLLDLEQEDIDYLSRKYSVFYMADKSKATDSTGLSVSTRQEDNSRENALRILGLDEHALPNDIQTAYRRLAKKYHPDTTQDGYMKLVLDEKFKEISEAYSRLK